jgi:hypothetical protein
MKLRVIAGALVITAYGASASAQNTDTTPQGGTPPGGVEYINAPEWASKPQASDLAPYRPIDASVPGGAMVDCAARADGRLVDCKTTEVRPSGSHYEFAGPLAVERLYRLKPTLADGRSVSGMHVVVTVVWK